MDMQVEIDRIVRRKELLSLLGLSESSLYRRIKSGDFPPPVRLGGPGTLAVGWRLSTVKQWIKERPAASATALCPLCDGVGVIDEELSEQSVA